MTCKWPNGNGGTCDTHFTMRKNYDDHVQAVHGTIGPDGVLVLRRFSCRMCPAEYAYKRCLARHVRQKHLGGGEKVTDDMFSIEYVRADA